MMENESYIRKIIKHDHNGNEEEYLVLGLLNITLLVQFFVLTRFQDNN